MKCEDLSGKNRYGQRAQGFHVVNLGRDKQKQEAGSGAIVTAILCCNKRADA